MEQYKKYPIIQIDGGAIMVDKYNSKHNLATNGKTVFIPTNFPGYSEEYRQTHWQNVIAHTGFESLKDSGLPLFEIPKKDTTIFDALDRAYKYLHALGFFTTPTNEGRIVENLLIQAGVRANEAAGGYTEEDINNAIIKGYELARDSFYYTDGSIQPEIMKYIQSLKKYPTSALVEGVLASQWVSNENGYGRVENFFLKVDKNNHIIIKDFYYS